MKLAIVGWRGMVGTTLMQRMSEEKDFDGHDVTLFTSSSKTEQTDYPACNAKLGRSYDFDALSKFDVIITAQGSEYTHEAYPKLREMGWNGYWIDAASALRMSDEAVLVLDPLNSEGIEAAIKSGKKTFVGANCTVSLLLLAFAPLFKEDLVQWVSTHSYQAASGAGAKALIELAEQCRWPDVEETNALKLCEAHAKEASQPTKSWEIFNPPLAYNVLPWIDAEVPGGQSKEEQKAHLEASKILGRSVAIDGNCVRVPALRSHSQSVLMKLKHDLSLSEIESMLKDSHQWMRYIPNNKEETLKFLNPQATSGTLDIAVGRLRFHNLEERLLGAFTVGDQLLWGAAEPLRRMLNIVKNTL